MNSRYIGNAVVGDYTSMPKWAECVQRIQSEGMFSKIQPNIAELDTADQEEIEINHDETPANHNIVKTHPLRRKFTVDVKVNA